MKVILKKDVDKVGKAMEVITVADGFARNFLLPSELAVVATAGNIGTLEAARKLEARKEEKKLKEARQLAKKIEKVPCTITAAVAEEEKLFGSVTAGDIADFLKKEGFEIERSAIELPEPIKQLGVYTVDVTLYKDAKAKLKVWVVKDESK
jgi:large subunit ribosomal protein L9